jgi:hypothetical protein
MQNKIVNDMCYSIYRGLEYDRYIQFRLSPPIKKRRDISIYKKKYECSEYLIEFCKFHVILVYYGIMSTRQHIKKYLFWNSNKIVTLTRKFRGKLEVICFNILISNLININSLIIEKEHSAKV